MFPINPKMNTIILNSKVSYCQNVDIPILTSQPIRKNKDKKVNKYVNIDKKMSKPLNEMGRVFMIPYNSRETGIPE